MSDTTYEASFPVEPEGLRIVLDREGDVWQRQKTDRLDEQWRCVKPKFQGFIGGISSTSWRHLVYSFGPLTAVQWASVTTAQETAP